MVRALGPQGPPPPRPPTSDLKLIEHLWDVLEEQPQSREALAHNLVGSAAPVLPAPHDTKGNVTEVVFMS